MKKIILVLLVIILVQKIQAQTFNASLIVEGAGLFSKVAYKIDQLNSKEENNYPFEYGVGIYWSGKWKLGTLYQIEIRPGWFVSSEHSFSSKQIGIYLRRQFGSDYVAGLGLNFESHYGGGGTTLIIKEQTYTISASFGKIILEDFLLHISISKPIDSYYSKYDSYSSTSRSYSSYLNWIVKVGLEYDF